MKHKKGDMVTIRSYKDMQREFKTIVLGGSEILSNGFSRNMSYLCGNTYEIRMVYKDEYRINDEIWSISDSMLEDDK